MPPKVGELRTCRPIVSSSVGNTTAQFWYHESFGDTLLSNETIRSSQSNVCQKFRFGSLVACECGVFQIDYQKIRKITMENNEKDKTKINIKMITKRVENTSIINYA